VASFSVLDARAAAKVAAQSQQYGGQPLLLSVLFAQAGLLDDAEDSLKRVLGKHPRHAVATGLMRDLQRIRKEGG
jgi:hypothetical protein